MYTNTSLWITQKACVTLSATTKINNKYYGNCKVYATSEILWKKL